MWDGITGKAATAADKFTQAAFQYIGNLIIPLRANNITYIREGYKENLFVNMCVSYITSRASDIPWKLYRKDAKGNEIEVTDHWALKLLEKPNPNQDFKEMIEQALGFYLLTGNTFQYKATPGVGVNADRPTELWNLPTPYMQIETSGQIFGEIVSYRLNTVAERPFEPSQILHVKTPNYEWDNSQHYYGLSPLRAALKTIALSNDNFEAMTKQAKFGGALGLLMYDKAGNDNQSITPDQMQALKTKIDQNINGSSNRGKIVGTSQMFKWQQLGMSAADLQLLQNHNISRDDICAIHNLSSMLFNDHSSSTYNNMQEVKKSAYTDAILPTLENYLSKFNQNVLAGEDVYFKIDTSGIEVLQKDKGQLIRDLSQAWWIPTSEKQKLSEIEPDGTLPEYLMPMNLMGVDDFTADEINPEKVAQSFERYPDA